MLTNCRLLSEAGCDLLGDPFGLLLPPVPDLVDQFVQRVSEFRAKCAVLAGCFSWPRLLVRTHASLLLATWHPTQLPLEVVSRDYRRDSTPAERSSMAECGSGQNPLLTLQAPYPLSNNHVGGFDWNTSDAHHVYASFRPQHTRNLQKLSVHFLFYNIRNCQFVNRQSLHRHCGLRACRSIAKCAVDLMQ